MSPELLERKFDEVGVPLELVPDREWFAINVGRNRAGEWITLSPGDAEVEVMDADRAHRQLLLLVKSENAFGRRGKSKILCGRDERTLFAVTVPGQLRSPVNTVAAAHEALKPAELRIAATRAGRGPRHRRPKFVRQGDWFFVPRPDLPRDLLGTRKKVHLGNTGGNPHIVDYLRGDERRFRDWLGRELAWGPVLARGFVRHRDHRTIHLRCWHEVFPNAASSAPGGYAD